MTFSKALEHLKNGERVSREGWNGRGMWLALITPSNTFPYEMTLPFIYMRTVHGDKVPWLASQTDLLEDDWFIV